MMDSYLKNKVVDYMEELETILTAEVGSLQMSKRTSSTRKDRLDLDWRIDEKSRKLENLRYHIEKLKND